MQRSRRARTPLSFTAQRLDAARERTQGLGGSANPSLPFGLGRLACVVVLAALASACHPSTPAGGQDVANNPSRPAPVPNTNSAAQGRPDVPSSNCSLLADDHDVACYRACTGDGAGPPVNIDPQSGSCTVEGYPKLTHAVYDNCCDRAGTSLVPWAWDSATGKVEDEVTLQFNLWFMSLVAATAGKDRNGNHTNIARPPACWAPPTGAVPCEFDFRCRFDGIGTKDDDEVMYCVPQGTLMNCCTWKDPNFEYPQCTDKKGRCSPTEVSSLDAVGAPAH